MSKQKFEFATIYVMKIAIVTNNYKPYSGGVVSSIDSFAQELVRRGHQVHIITLDFEGVGNSCDGLVQIVRLFCPFRFRYRTLPVAVPLWPERALRQILLQIKPDLIHAQQPFLLGPAALKFGLWAKLPVVFTYHSQYEQFSHWLPVPDRLAISLIRHYTINFCQAVNGIIAPSKAVARQISSTGCQTNLAIIPSGILPIFMRTTWMSKPVRSVFQLLTVSRFAKEKNLPFLLLLCTKLPDFFQLQLVGYGPELAFLQHYAYQILGLPISRVQFIERPCKSELRQLYAQADLFVFASLAETQGLVLAEAMASGTPVVARVGPGQDELVVNGKNGFLVHSLDEMAATVQHVAQQPELHLKLQYGAWQTGQDYYPAALTTKLLDFYGQFTRI